MRLPSGDMVKVNYYLAGRYHDDPMARVVGIEGPGWAWAPPESAEGEEQSGFVIRELLGDVALIEGVDGIIVSVSLVTAKGLYTPVHPQVRTDLKVAATELTGLDADVTEELAELEVKNDPLGKVLSALDLALQEALTEQEPERSSGRRRRSGKKAAQESVTLNSAGPEQGIAVHEVTSRWGRAVPSPSHMGT